MVFFFEGGLHDLYWAHFGPFWAILGPFWVQKLLNNLFRFNLDARSVPEALVNSFRILTQLRTRLNPPEPQIPSKKNSVRISLKSAFRCPHHVGHLKAEWTIPYHRGLKAEMVCPCKPRVMVNGPTSTWSSHVIMSSAKNPKSCFASISTPGASQKLSLTASDSSRPSAPA